MWLKKILVYSCTETPLGPLNVATQASLIKPDAGTARALEECSGRHQVPAKAATDSTFSVKFGADMIRND